MDRIVFGAQVQVPQYLHWESSWYSELGYTPALTFYVHPVFTIPEIAKASMQQYPVTTVGRF